MGIMKRIYQHRIENGIPLNIEVKLNPVAFGLAPPQKKKSKKKKTKKEVSAITDKSSRPSVLDDAIANAEKLLGREITIEDITGGAKNAEGHDKEHGDSD